jgi:hypothetical protein
MSKREYFAVSHMAVHQARRSLNYGVEGAHEIAPMDFRNREITIEKIMRLPFPDRHLPLAARRIVSRERHRETSIPLLREDSSKTRTAIRRLVHLHLATRTAMDEEETVFTRHFRIWKVEAPMHIPDESVATIPRRNLANAIGTILVRRLD